MTAWHRTLFDVIAWQWVIGETIGSLSRWVISRITFPFRPPQIHVKFLQRSWPCVVQSRLSGKLAFHRDNSTKVEDRSRSAGVRPAGGILPWSVFEICDLLLWHFKMQGPFRRRHISFYAINQLLDIYFEPNPLVCLLSLLPFSLRCVLFWSSYFRWLGKLLS